MQANSNKAIREALEEIVNHHCRNCTEDTQYGCGVNIGGLLGFKCTLLEQARTALAAPPRNCDLGTPDEQAERFEDFCLKHIGCAEETGGRHCVGCPLEKASMKTTQKCELYWAQIPYEEGEADGSR